MIFQNKMQQFIDNASKKKRLAEQMARMRRSTHDVSIWLQYQQCTMLEYATDKTVIRIAKALNRIERLLIRIHKHIVNAMNHYESTEYGKSEKTP